MISVYRIGQKVGLGDDIIQTPGLIIGIIIRENGYTQYEVTWWEDKTVKSSWFSAREFSVMNETEKEQVEDNKIDD
jgi:hypothetical protein